MILLMGEPNDILIQEVDSRLRAARVPVQIVHETVLFTQVPFTFERHGRSRGGALQLDGQNISFAELSGVLVRLPRTWWPSTEFDLQDQVFVYHETTAAWFALLSSLHCPLVNRFELGWWLQDFTYPELLRKQFAARLQLDLSTAAPIVSTPGDMDSGMGELSSEHSVIYIVGEHLIPGSTGGDKPLALLKRKTDALVRWQREHGVEFCAVHFQHNRTASVQRVDIFPQLDGEQAEIVNQIGAAIARIFL